MASEFKSRVDYSAVAEQVVGSLSSNAMLSLKRMAKSFAEDYYGAYDGLEIAAVITDGLKELRKKGAVMIADADDALGATRIDQEFKIEIGVFSPTDLWSTLIHLTRISRAKARSSGMDLEQETLHVCHALSDHITRLHEYVPLPRLSAPPPHQPDTALWERILGESYDSRATIAASALDPFSPLALAQLASVVFATIRNSATGSEWHRVNAGKDGSRQVVGTGVRAKNASVAALAHQADVLSYKEWKQLAGVVAMRTAAFIEAYEGGTGPADPAIDATRMVEPLEAKLLAMRGSARKPKLG